MANRIQKLISEAQLLNEVMLDALALFKEENEHVATGEDIISNPAFRAIYAKLRAKVDELSEEVEKLK